MKSRRSPAFAYYDVKRLERVKKLVCLRFYFIHIVGMIAMVLEYVTFGWSHWASRSLVLQTI